MKRKLILQAFVVAVMGCIVLLEPKPALALDGCLVCITDDGCPDYVLGNTYCNDRTPCPVMNYCVDTDPQCGVNRRAIYCYDP